LVQLRWILTWILIRITSNQGSFDMIFIDLPCEFPLDIIFRPCTRNTDVVRTTTSHQRTLRPQQTGQI
jgi:hypothetical protein